MSCDPRNSFVAVDLLTKQPDNYSSVAPVASWFDFHCGLICALDFDRPSIVVR